MLSVIATAPAMRNAPANRHILLQELRILGVVEDKKLLAMSVTTQLNAADHFAKLLSRDAFHIAKHVSCVSSANSHSPLRSFP